MSDELGDTVDVLLIGDAARWRATLPYDPGPDVVLQRAAAAQRRWGWPALAAAAVVVLISLGTLALTQQGDDATSPPLRDTTAPVSVPSGRCEDQFTPGPSSYVPTDPQAFQNMTVKLTYTGPDLCRISAYGPWADLLAVDGTHLGTAAHTTLEARPPGYLELVHGEKVIVEMRWSPGCGTKLPPVTSVVLHMSGQPDTSDDGVHVSVADNYRPDCVTGLVDPSQIVGYTNVRLVPIP